LLRSPALWVIAIGLFNCFPVIGMPMSKEFCADTLSKNDTLPGLGKDSLRFPLSDRRSDPISAPSKNPFDLKDPFNIKDSIVYDPQTKRYYIFEKIGDHYYREPTYLTFDEMMRWQISKDEGDYFRARADALAALNKKLLRPKLSVTDDLFNRLFGNGKVDVKPQGTVSIAAGYQGQSIQNPTLPESSRNTGGFDFNMNANLSVLGNIGNRLKLPISYNTQANSSFENQLKLEYTGGTDDIIKKIEAGNVSFSTKSTLITGAQSLFGLKTQLQFGKLYITGVLASQRSSTQSSGSQGGATTTSFSFKADDYDENRHFLLSQYFRSNFSKALSKIPVVNSQVQILKIEVWVTNRNGVVSGARDVVGLMDLGEASPYNSHIKGQASVAYPYNDANTEYRSVINGAGSRQSSSVATMLNGLGLSQVQDYEKVYARKLNGSDFYYNPQIGFISINTTLRSDDVLAVAYQYSYNGTTYQVGEFSQDVPPDTSQGYNPGAQKILYLKLLKATAQRTRLPIWGLMMKNIYSLKTSAGSVLTGLQKTGFVLNVLYNEASKGTKRYLPEGPKAGTALLSVLNLDRLNSNNDASPDGIFDYEEGFTVLSTQGVVIFPVLEPFGKDLDSLAFSNASQTLKDKYVFYHLYDTIKEVAKTYANTDRYYLSGTAKGQAASGNLSLGAVNVPQGSVVVTAGGQTLKENVDYVVDYPNGTVQVINQAIINSGVAVNVSFENNATSGLQSKGFMALRLDYEAFNTASRSLSLGATIERLSERPYFTKTSYGEDPIRNTMYGLDINYRTQAPGLTRLLNKLPFYSSHEVSTVTAYGEAAYLKPGHAKQIGSGSSGTVYVDDFEGSTSAIDLEYPVINWALASTPQSNGLFPEGSLKDSIDYGFNRARIAWYNIETTLQDKSSSSNPVRSYENFSDPRIMAITTQELFPELTTATGTSTQLTTFDLAYYPSDRGPYNYDSRTGSVSSDGKLLNPKQRWGGIMRSIDQSDFESANIQYIEFWMQDPFILNPSGKGGQLYFDLGSVSEDILRDGKRMYENGMPTPNISAAVDTSAWGKMPANNTQVTNAFSSDASDRPYQDIGYDGLSDTAEERQFAYYLNKLKISYGVNSTIYQQAEKDPSSDDFKYYRNSDYDNSKTGILGRYKNYNGPEGNSPVATSSTVQAFTMYPDEEDINRDNTMNELESYFEYKVNLSPDSLVVDKNFITDKRSFTPSGGVTQNWYQFRIPITAYTQAVGGITDFKSIQFIRLFLTGFADSVVCRFAKFDLVRDSWRTFNYVLDTTGNYTALSTTSSTTFAVTAVNIEQNSSRTPVAYISPPGVERQQELSNNNVNLLLNEQALSLQICNLVNKDSRGVYKTTTLDLRKYGKLDMFIHAESAAATDNLSNGDLSAVLRLGSDLTDNYYEIRMPLQITRWGATTSETVWPTANNLNLTLSRLVQLKEKRNSVGQNNVYYKETDTDGRQYAILGNPSLGEVDQLFLGVENVNQPTICTEVWFNELRLSDLDEKGAWATVGKVDVKLADLGTVSLAGSMKTAGWGTIDQRINERSTEDDIQYNMAASLELGKLLPKKASLSIPFYGSLAKTISNPEYDPYDLDIKLKDKLKMAASKAARDSIRDYASEVTTVSTINFTNVRKIPAASKKLKIWSLENLTLNYSYTSSQHHNPTTLEDETINYKGSLAYNYAHTPVYWAPWKKVIRSKSSWLGLLKAFNLNFTPTVLGFQTDIARQFAAFRSRNVDGGAKDALPESYNKYFTFNRSYTLRWDLTKSLNIDFTALNKAWVDEDSGRLDQSGRRRMWNNFLKGGRTTSYTQTATATYSLPTSYFPVTDWTQARLSYTATYGWTAASTTATSLGNELQNTQSESAIVDLDFTRLYKKSRWLRALEPVTKNPEKSLPKLGGFVTLLGRIVTSVKHINLSYSENSSSTIYGYMDSTQIIGMDLHSKEPGWGYIFGQQPDTNFINRLGKKGLLSTDTSFNSQNQLTFTQKFSLSATLQPIPGLDIQLSLDKSFGKNYSELYKDTAGGAGLSRLNPYSTGTFSVSFISFQTLFEKFRPTAISGTFQQFENNRAVISNRLGQENPYSAGLTGTDGYAAGYGKYSQDVLIPAFIAAYTHKDPYKIALVNEGGSGVRSNPFSGYIPKPNWHLTYSGLSKLPFFDKLFTSFIITNAYTGLLSMGSFNSNTNYKDPMGYGQAGFIDTLTGNFVPYFQVPNITMTEQFSPLIDVDMTFRNQASVKIGYSKSRQLSLSLTDYQMTEARSSELTIGAGWKKKGLRLPFNITLPGKGGGDGSGSNVQGKGSTGKGGTGNGSSPTNQGNDVTFRLDVSIRDDISTNTYLDQTSSTPTAGQRIIRVAPSVDVVLNKKISCKLYFDRSHTIPRLSSSYPTTTTKAGIQIQISLSP